MKGIANKWTVLCLFFCIVGLFLWKLFGGYGTPVADAVPMSKSIPVRIVLYVDGDPHALKDAERLRVVDFRVNCLFPGMEEAVNRRIGAVSGVSIQVIDATHIRIEK